MVQQTWFESGSANSENLDWLIQSNTSLNGSMQIAHVQSSSVGHHNIKTGSKNKPKQMAWLVNPVPEAARHHHPEPNTHAVCHFKKYLFLF